MDALAVAVPATVIVDLTPVQINVIAVPLIGAFFLAAVLIGLILVRR